MQVADVIGSMLGSDLPIRVLGYDGSKAGPDTAETAVRVVSPRALARLATAPGSLGLARAYVTGELEVEGDLYALLDGIADVTLNAIPRAEQLRLARKLAAVALRHRVAAAGPRVPPAGPAALQEARQQGDRAPLRRVEHLLRVGARAVDGLHVRGLPDRRTPRSSRRSAAKFELVAQKLALKPGMRLLDVGCGWGAMVMHAAAEHGVRALGVTLSRNQAEWAQKEIERRGLGDLAEVRHLDYRDTPAEQFDAVSSIGLTEHLGPGRAAGVLPVPREPAAAGRAAAQPLHHAEPHPEHQADRTRSSTATSSRTASCTRSGTSSR